MPDYTVPVFDNGTVLVNGTPTGDFRLLLANGSTIEFQSDSIVKMVITDNGADVRLSNDNNTNESADDGNQQTTTITGQVEKVYLDFTYTVSDPQGNTYTLYVIDVGNSPDSSLANNRAVTYIGFQDTNKPPVGVPLTVTGLNNTGTVAYNTIMCFADGTAIAVPGGTKRAGDLRPGDRVITRRGIARLVWVGRRHLSPLELYRRPGFRPVLIEAGALGEGMPRADTTVSPQHRIWVDGPELELLFGIPGALAPAKGLVDGGSIRLAAPGDGVSYVHLLFEQHELLSANGLWAESLLMAPHSCAGLPAFEASEDGALMPEAVETGIVHATPAAPLLKTYEARLLARLRAVGQSRHVARGSFARSCRGLSSGQGIERTGTWPRATGSSTT